MTGHFPPPANICPRLGLEYVYSTWTSLNWPKLTCNESTQLHDAFIGHARHRRDLIGCSETRAVSAQPVQDARIRMQLAYIHTGVRELEFSLVSLCAATKHLWFKVRIIAKILGYGHG